MCPLDDLKHNEIKTIFLPFRYKIFIPCLTSYCKICFSLPQNTSLCQT